jgi:nucleoid-associated protein YgaU
MANLFQNPLQALRGQDSGPNQSHLASPELAKRNDGSDLDVETGWEFVGEDIDATRWNKSYPYQILIMEKLGDDYRIKSTFTLPIPPQDMSISMPFAITTNVTLGGIVEEHNGAPLRLISFSGTTGVLPLKGTGEILRQASVTEGIFAGTVSAGGNLLGSINTLTDSKESPNLVDDTNEDTLKGTGYYQFRLLQRFLESYAAQKKTLKGANLRLALAIWKDQSIYLVTPTGFDVRRGASSPWEYQYSLQFKAWKRIRSRNVGIDTDTFNPVVRNANAFAQLLNKIEDARRVLQNGRDVLLAVQGDVERLILEPLREVTLFCKDALGVAATAADLPASIAKTLKSAVAEAKDRFSALGADVQSLGIRSGKAESGASDTDTTSAVMSGAEPANKAFDHPEENFELMSKIKPSDLNLPVSVLRKIDEEKARVRGLTRLDFETYRDQFVDFLEQFSDAVGAGSEAYNSIYNRPTTTATKAPTQDDYDVIYAMNQVVLEMNRLAASYDTDRGSITTLEAVAGMASASGIAFRMPVSKFAVPFPYGSTLEQLAAQYLGNANRWHEIAALNGLRQPYIDEEGFDLQLLVNASGSQVIVSDASKLYLGQPVWISSSTVSKTKRHITKIIPVSNTSIVTLDGDSDLDAYTLADGAVLHAFLPDTVNSQMLIYIPSDQEPADGDFKTKAIPGINEFDPLIQTGGVDLLLTQSGDLAITPDGDCRLAIGLTNLVQRIRTAIGTPRGSLLHHPEYGLSVILGVSTADVDAKDLKARLQDLLTSDPAFSGVSGVVVQKNGPVLKISMTVGVSGTNHTIPVTVEIKP